MGGGSCGGCSIVYCGLQDLPVLLPGSLGNGCPHRWKVINASDHAEFQQGIQVYCPPFFHRIGTRTSTSSVGSSGARIPPWMAVIKVWSWSNVRPPTVGGVGSAPTLLVLAGAPVSPPLVPPLPWLVPYRCKWES